MHEMSLCESIISIVEQQSKLNNFTEVKVVCLEVGQFSGVEMEALRFSFDCVTRGTCAENAKLKIIETEAEAWCLPCANAVRVSHRYDACPKCGSHQLQLSGGDELKIKELEVN